MFTDEDVESAQCQHADLPAQVVRVMEEVTQWEWGAHVWDDFIVEDVKNLQVLRLAQL